MMASIHKLDPNVQKILKSQAFTVSMASAVTEVVQNSLDAQANQVDISIDIGKLSFTVSDNGVGMIPGDLNRLGAHNSTSKINTLRDLANLKTYGFRGEALFCISSVSHMIVVSKVKEYNSTWIRRLPNSATMLSVEPREDDISVPLDSGTTVVVQDLLHNIPVRRKILQNEPAFKTYMSLKENLFQLLILHPELQLTVRYINDAEERHQLFASKQISSHMKPYEKLSLTFLNTFGSVVPIESLKKVSVDFKEFRLNGIISKVAVRVRDYQLIYINGRRYHNASFLRTLENMFQAAGFGNDESNKTSVKSVGRPYTCHALIIIDIRCPLVTDDLMQDPSKKILLSSQADVIHPLILKVVQSFLSHQGYVPFSHVTADGENINNKLLKTPQASSQSVSTVLDSKIRMAKINNREIEGRVLKTSISGRGHQKLRPSIEKVFLGRKSITHDLKDRFLRETSQIPERIEQISFSNNHTIDRTQLNDAEIINQVGKKFILARIWPHGKVKHPTLIIVDQHASDERIKLETYLKSFIHEVLGHTIQSQPIHNCRIEISATETELFRHFEKEFNTWGIFYYLTSNPLEDSYLEVKSLPVILSEKADGDIGYLKRALQQIAEDLKSFKKLPIVNKKEDPFSTIEWWKYVSCIPVVFREIFNSKACRSAIMFGDSLTKVECTSILKELTKCWLPFQCAHGRPSMIPLAELKQGSNLLIEREITAALPDYETSE